MGQKQWVETVKSADKFSSLAQAQQQACKRYSQQYKDNKLEYIDMNTIKATSLLTKEEAEAAYEDCLRPRDPEYLLDVKRGFYNLEDARVVANTAIANVIRVADTFCERVEDRVDEAAQDLLNTVQYNIMYSAIVERRVTLR